MVDRCRLWSVGRLEGVEREGVRKRISSHIHINMLHLLCTSLTLIIQLLYTVKVNYRGQL